MTHTNLFKRKTKLLFSFLVSFTYSTAQVHSPEYTSFEPVNADNMVDLVTGDFTYNIPLFDVPGIGGSYPINLFYHAGITMDQEASWTGLGWNINVGTIERNVNGYPDDFKNRSYYSSTKTERVDWFKYSDQSNVSTDKYYWNIGKGIGIGFKPPINIKHTSSDAMSNIIKGASVYGDVYSTYGPLYFKDAKSSTTAWGTQNRNTVMDSYSNAYNASTYNSASANDASNNLTLPNYDDYIVSANGLIGSISPKIFEFGSIANRGYVSDRFGDEDNTPSKELVYNNRYDFTKAHDKIHFYFNGENSSYLKINNGSFSSTNPNGDPIWDNLYSGSNLSTTNPDGKSFYDPTSKRKGGVKFVQWYTNSEMNANQVALGEKGVMEYEKLLEQRDDDAMFDADGIGGYSITDENGITYHYALPVYNFSEYKVNENISDPVNDFYETGTDNKYATSWLLTAITGNDFVDKGTIGVIDEEDLGYWVKFDYGKWSDGYMWKTPYSGYEKTANGRGSYAFGRKQIYYLNYIKTKTHTAYFIKELREDGLGMDQFQNNNRTKYYYPIGTPNGLLMFAYGDYNSFLIPEKHKLLRLAKIILMKNEDITINCNDGSDLISTKTGYMYKTHWTMAATNTVYNNPPISTTVATFQLNYNDNVIDVNDIQGMESIISSKALKIVNFNYNYSLCMGVPNTTNPAPIGVSYISSPTTTGRLTLKAVNMTDGYGVLNMPEYKFDYYNSTGYNTDNKDDWGYFVGSSVNSTSITNKDQFPKPDINSWSLKEITTPLGGRIKVNYEADTYNKEAFTNTSLSGTGGGIRVRKIETIDENNNSTALEYNYLDPNTNLTSGITCYAPIRGERYIPYAFELPSAGIMYKYVTVKNTGSNGFSTGKIQYKFKVYEKNSVSQNGFNYSIGDIIKINDIQPAYPIVMKETGPHSAYVVARSALISDFSASLGKPLNIQTFDKNNNILSETIYDYFKPDEIKSGITQETFCSVKQLTQWNQRQHVSSTNFHFMTSASKITYPCILKSLTINEKGIVKTTTNKMFDFNTGIPTETQSENSIGEKYYTKSIPAYDKYGSIETDMGSKVYDVNNKNMLVQGTASYLYAGDAVNNANLLSASVQTWHDTWNYREYISSAYTNDPQTDVWRKYKTYVWKTDVYNDGTAASFTDFNWVSTPNAGWQKTNEVTLYDHYSQAIESKDINGNYAAVKKGGMNGNFVIASSGSSNYESFFHSGFEDLLSNNYFGGEVAMQDGIHVASNGTINAHTGKYLVKTQSSYQGPVFKVSSNLQTGKTYQASVWVHKDSPSNTALYAILDGTAGSAINVTKTMLKTDANAVQVGDWILLKVDIDVPSNYVHSGGSFNDLRTYVYTGTGGYAYTDDMRLQPVNSPVTGYIYDEKTGFLTAILDNENFATVYSYDNAGRLIKTEKETATGIKKVSETWYHYGRP